MRKLKHVKLYIIEALANRSECVARKVGLVGVMRAPVESGPYKGHTLGYSLAVDKLYSDK